MSVDLLVRDHELIPVLLVREIQLTAAVVCPLVSRAMDVAVSQLVGESANFRICQLIGQDESAEFWNFSAKRSESDFGLVSLLVRQSQLIEESGASSLVRDSVDCSTDLPPGESGEDSVCQLISQ